MYFISTDPEPEKDGVKKGLLFPALALLLGGGGYLAYSTFINPTTPLGPSPGSGGTPGSRSPSAPPQPQLSPEEAERRRKQMLAEMKRKEALQKVAKEKSQAEKDKKRDAILSAFKEDKLAEKGKEIANKNAENLKKQINEATKPQPKPQPQPQVKTENKTTPIKEKVQAKKFTSLDELAKGEDQDALNKLVTLTGTPKTTNEAIQRLANISGQEHAHIRKTINNSPSGEQLAGIFENAEKKHVIPKHITPVFQHLIDKGKIDHLTAHEAVHHLANQEKITELQKQKILKDLQALKDM